MIKLLVTSTIKMTEDEFFSYAKSVESRVPGVDRDKFAGTLLSGKPVIVNYPDGTHTSYEAVTWLN